MRDLDRVREKIEIRLEPRQVVGLAVATMLLSGGLFGAGYLVGHNRGSDTAGGPQTAEKLANLDAAADSRSEAAAELEAPAEVRRALGEVEFLFPSALGSRPARKRPRRRAMKLAPGRVSVRSNKPAKIPVKASPKPVRRSVSKVKAPSRSARSVGEGAVEDRPVVVRPRSEPPKRLPVVKLTPKQVIAPASPRAAAPARPVEDEDTPATRAVAKPVSKPSQAYTLQVKSSRSKEDADRFVRRLRKSGFDPHVVLSTVPGKGRYYRVRLGKFKSMQAARAFQRKYKAVSGQPDAGFVTDI